MQMTFEHNAQQGQRIASCANVLKAIQVAQALVHCEQNDDWGLKPTRGMQRRTIGRLKPESLLLFSLFISYRRRLVRFSNAQHRCRNTQLLCKRPAIGKTCKEVQINIERA